MRPKAIIFDIYQTLLKVILHSLELQEKLWCELCIRFFAREPRISFMSFSKECDRLIAWQREQSIKRGIAFPEVNWEEIVKIAFPEVLCLNYVEFDEFIQQQSRVWHSVEIYPGAIEFLKFAINKKIILGIASNCQKYTLKELETALEKHNLSIDIFEPELCFYSFKYGFGKPDPHVFQILSSRLEQSGIKPVEILMVGDGIENDIIPSRRFGWNWWLLSDSKLDLYENSGNWEMLKMKLE